MSGPQKRLIQLKEKNKTDYDYHFKIAVINTSDDNGGARLTVRFVNNKYVNYASTTNSYQKKIKLENKVIDLSIFNSSKMESSYGYNNSEKIHGYIIEFDVTDRVSYSNAQALCKKMNSQPIILIGTKAENTSKKVIDYDEAQEFAEEQKITYIEASAKTNGNVALAFETIAATILFSIQKQKAPLKPIYQPLALAEEPPQANYTCKIIISGKKNSGKTELINRFILDDYGRNDNLLSYKLINYKNVGINLNFTETSSKKHLPDLSAISNAKLLVITIDMTNEKNIDDLANEFLDLNIATRKLIRDKLVIVGTKSDAVADETCDSFETKAQKLAEKYGVHYVSSSAKKGENVNCIFEQTLNLDSYVNEMQQKQKRDEALKSALELTRSYYFKREANKDPYYHWYSPLLIFAVHREKKLLGAQAFEEAIEKALNNSEKTSLQEHKKALGGGELGDIYESVKLYL